MAKLSTLCSICSLGQVKLSLDMCLMTFYLSLGRYQLLLFLSPDSLCIWAAKDHERLYKFAGSSEPLLPVNVISTNISIAG